MRRIIPSSSQQAATITNDVEIIDRRHVWGKRYYKVRDGKIPGTFCLSVLDNDVTSNTGRTNSNSVKIMGESP